MPRVFGLFDLPFLTPRQGMEGFEDYPDGASTTTLSLGAGFDGAAVLVQAVGGEENLETYEDAGDPTALSGGTGWDGSSTLKYPA